MRRALVVYELRIDEGCTQEKLRSFMDALLHVDNFGLSVSRIWETHGQPPMSLVSHYGNDATDSKLKRVRIIT